MSADRHDSPFGTILTAMVSPMFPDGEVDYEGAGRLASHLVDIGNDGLVVNGTTGEAPTTNDQEKDGLLRAVLEAVGDRAVVVAGVGTNDTRHSIELARQAEHAGAHGLLAVTPYYSKPPQAGIAAHFTAIADAVGVPIMLYDIPGRAGTAIDWQTLVFLAEHPQIAAVKDAKADLESVVEVMRRTDMQWYSGDDGLTLPFLSIGAAGVVSVTGHLVAGRMRAMADLFWAGEVGAATAMNEALQPVTTGLFRTQGAILAKAALNELGHPAGPMRLPLIDATPEQLAVLRLDLATGGVDGFSASNTSETSGDNA